MPVDALERLRAHVEAVPGVQVSVHWGPRVGYWISISVFGGSRSWWSNEGETLDQLVDRVIAATHRLSRCESTEEVCRAR